MQREPESYTQRVRRTIEISAAEKCDLELFPGFPKKPDTKLVFPTRETDIKSHELLYTDFLYHDAYVSFAEYAFDYYKNVEGISPEQKGAYFNNALDFLYTPQIYISRPRERGGDLDPLNSNCVVSTKIHILKLLGLIPADFKIMMCSEKNCEEIYGAVLSSFIKKQFSMNIYVFTYLLGCTGITKICEDFMKENFNYLPGKDTKLSTFVTEVLNTRIISHLRCYSPKKICKYRMDLIEVKKIDNPEKNLILKKLKTFLPIGLQVVIDKRGQNPIAHYITMVYNPFVHYLFVFDPLDGNHKRKFRYPINSDKGFETFKVATSIGSSYQYILGVPDSYYQVSIL